MAAHTRDDDSVKGVSLPIATTIKSVPICLSARRWDRAGSAQLCKRGLRADALRVTSASLRPCLSLSRAPGQSPERASRSVYRGVHHHDP
jgi:hypothetical protein